VLFHYHFWTPHLEEMEKFYEDLGFRVNQRVGKYKGTFQTFNPPLSWDEFRDQGIIFRIIEMKKGNVNISFGFGKRIMFDHIGFLVTNEEKSKICENANLLNWKVELGERRTFITTPYQFLIELQTHLDAVDGDGKIAEIDKMVISTPIEGLEEDLEMLFGKKVLEIQSTIEEPVMLKEVKLSLVNKNDIIDPNGVQINLDSGAES
jgi:catechol 2,3-dioxygenase-like lactoylglutathione lyase family enzyme